MILPSLAIDPRELAAATGWKLELRRLGHAELSVVHFREAHRLQPENRTYYARLELSEPSAVTARSRRSSVRPRPSSSMAS